MFKIKETNLERKLLSYIVLILFFVLSIFIVNGTFISIIPSTPLNKTWTNNNQPDFTFTPTSNINTTFPCILMIDNIKYGTNYTSLNNSLTNITANLTLTQGTHSWFINCTDVNGSNFSITRTIYVDTSNPSSSITLPLTNTSTNDTTVEINFTLIDNLATALNYY